MALAKMCLGVPAVHCNGSYFHVKSDLAASKHREMGGGGEFTHDYDTLLEIVRFG